MQFNGSNCFYSSTCFRVSVGYFAVVGNVVCLSTKYFLNGTSCWFGSPISASQSWSINSHCGIQQICYLTVLGQTRWRLHAWHWPTSRAYDRWRGGVFSEPLIHYGELFFILDLLKFFNLLCLAHEV